MRPEEREELLAAYALGTLSEPDTAAVRDLVRQDRAAADELASYHDIVDLISLSAPLRRADPSLRARVLDAARRGGHERPGRWSARRLLPWVAAVAASVAVLALTVSWGASTQRSLEAMRRDNSALTALVASQSKSLEALLALPEGDINSRVLRLQLESTEANMQLALAVTTAADVLDAALLPTSAGHGAGGQFLWSSELGAGWLTVRGLPALPLNQVYQVWLSDGEGAVSAGLFLPDANGDGESVVRAESAIAPDRIVIAVAPEGGSQEPGSPRVLEGMLAR